MSVDLEIWSVAKFEQSSLDQMGLIRFHGGLRFLARNWRVIIEEPVEVDEDQIPELLIPQVVGLRFFTRMSLEPGHPRQSVFAN
jgi:hypothetical protein